MTHPTLTTLKETLPGTWESPEMMLEFYGAGAVNLNSGKLSLHPGLKETYFSYDIFLEEDKVFLSMATETADIMDCELTGWGSDWLKFTMDGIPHQVHLVQK